MNRYRRIAAGHLLLGAYKLGQLIAGKRWAGVVGYSLTVQTIETLHKLGWHVVKLDEATEPGERPIITERWTP